MSLIAASNLSALLVALATGSSGTPDLLVVSRFTSEVLRFDGTSGAPLGTFAADPNLVNPVGITFGPDGNLYVSSFVTNTVLRFDGTSGAFDRVFASGGGLRNPMSLAFGNDGNLYVCSASTSQVLRYDGTSGAFIDVFAPAGPLATPIGLTFGPDGDLYVGSFANHRVLRYDGTTGSLVGALAIGAPLQSPQDLEFGPDGNLYVVDSMTQAVLRYDSTGHFLGIFANAGGLQTPIAMTWGWDGNLYVANQMAHSVLEYDGTSGALLQTFVAPSSGGMNGASYLLFMPTRPLQLCDPGTVTAGQSTTLTVVGARPGARLRLLSGAQPGPVSLPTCVPLALDVSPPIVRAIGIADGGGLRSIRRTVPARVRGATVRVQALDVARCEVSNVVTITIQ
ncbi:MAG: NHL repeat-containing protein [Planctomycetes bacterium]|nr:NHL repeat-containing protein [Planctomycetota bacterium]MBI3843386.1 NHL repeat-containing protein [Planctomycetota bacterium]